MPHSLLRLAAARPQAFVALRPRVILPPRRVALRLRAMHEGHSEPPPPVTQELDAPRISARPPSPMRRAYLIGGAAGAVAGLGAVLALSAGHQPGRRPLDPAAAAERLSVMRDRFPEVSTTLPCDDAALPDHGSIPVVAYSSLDGSGGFASVDEDLGVAPSTSPLSTAALSRVAREPLFAVLRTVSATMPKIVAGRLEPGAYHGQLAIFDRATALPLCYAPVDAQSSRVAAKGLDARGDDAAREDLRGRMRAAREEARARLSSRLQLDY